MIFSNRLFPDCATLLRKYSYFDLRADEIAEGEVILDGRMRFALDEDGLSVDVSLLVTGSAVESGVVIEGDFDISIEGSSAVISSGEVTIDGDEYELPSFGFTLPESGGSNG